MSSDQTWVEALKINPESLSEWGQQAPAGTPLLVWCLTNGHVNIEDYLAWACEHFGLPILNSAFFHQSFDLESLKISKPSWSAWCFPVGQWEDVVMVACAEPPSELPDGKFAFLLADPAAMNEIWNQAESGANTEGEATPPPLPVDAPAGINPNPTRTFVLNLDDASLMGEHSESVDPNPIAKPEEKTELTLSVVLDRSSETKKTVLTAVPTDTPPPAPMPKSTAKIAVPKSATVGELDSEIVAGFESLHENYQSSLVMRCLENVAKPYKWEAQLKIVEGDEKFNMNLGFPSFFRIVSKTMQPYHGFVIDSPAHREFFQHLSFDSLPACVTAIPLKSGDTLWGILVAFGGEAAQTNEALDQALAISGRISQALGSAKAAA